MCQHFNSFKFTPPTALTLVYRDECTQCFDSPDNTQGLDVCLTCFNGACHHTHAKRHYSLCPSHSLVLNIKRTPKVQHSSQQPPPKKMSKVMVEAQVADTELFDYSYSVYCLACDKLVETSPADLQLIQAGIMNSTSAAQKADIKQWQEVVEPCEHTLCLEQFETPVKSSVKHCADCEKSDNLWMCLTCGNLGCGREQYDGTGGNNHGSQHAQLTGHQVSCKIGTLTAEGTVDVFCYVCQDMREDPDVRKHLSALGVIVGKDQQRTEKSMDELQLEQNFKFDFNMATDDGKTLELLFGAGLTGMKNIGNSCYIASVVQSLLSVPAMRRRYAAMKHSDTCNASAPASCYMCQIKKLSSGLFDGKYSVPSSRPIPFAQDDGLKEQDLIRFQDGVAPRMFKDVVSKGHPDFESMQQQDAFEFLVYLLKTMSEKEQGTAQETPLDYVGFLSAKRIECSSCHKVRYHMEHTEGVEIPVPATVVSKTDDSSDDVSYQPVSMDTCLAAFAGEDFIEGFKCPSCQVTGLAHQCTRFESFPPVLVMHMQRFVLDNWVPKKLNVPIFVDKDTLDLSGLKNTGLQPGEQVMADGAEPEAGPFAGIPDAAIEQLMGMGFSRNRSGRALMSNANAVEPAMEWLFTKMDDASLDLPPVAASRAVKPVSDMLTQPLMDMGFTKPQTIKALRQSNMDVVRAVEWLFSNPTDPGESETPYSSTRTAPKKLPLTDKTTSKYVLHAIIAHKGTSTQCGHYVAYVRQPNGQYVLFNDEKVVAVSHEDIFTEPKSADGAGMGYLYIWLNESFTQ